MTTLDLLVTVLTIAVTLPASLVITTAMMTAAVILVRGR